MSADLEGLVRDLHGDVQAQGAILKRVEDRLTKQNGTVADIREEQLVQRGAMGALRWMVTLTIAMVSAGAAVAGVVLAILARGVG